MCLNFKLGGFVLKFPLPPFPQGGLGPRPRVQPEPARAGGVQPGSPRHPDHPHRGRGHQENVWKQY